MGVAVSKTSVDIVNQAIIDVLIENAQSCSAGVEANQTTTLSGFGLFNSFSQDASANVSCLQTIKIDNDLVTSIAEKIQQEAEANGVSLLPGFSGSEGVANISNVVKTGLTEKTVQDCAAGALANQSTFASGFQAFIGVDQTADAFSKCMQSALNSNHIAQDLVQDVDQKAKSLLENPLDFLSSLAWAGIVFLIILVVVIILILRALFGGGSAPAAPATNAAL